MTDLREHVASLQRPRLLIRAARFGLGDYRRSPALRRRLAAAGAHSAPQAVRWLLAREAEADAQRRAGDTAYSVARHVELLIALMAEAQLLPAAAAERSAPPRRAAPQPKASDMAALRRATKSSSASRWAMSMAGA